MLSIACIDAIYACVAQRCGRGLSLRYSAVWNITSAAEHSSLCLLSVLSCSPNGHKLSVASALKADRPENDVNKAQLYAQPMHIQALVCGRHPSCLTGR